MRPIFGCVLTALLATQIVTHAHIPHTTEVKGPSSQELAEAILGVVDNDYPASPEGSFPPTVLTSGSVCGQPLGLTTGGIGDSQITTSSDYDSNHDRRGCRLLTSTQPVQSWSARHNNLDQFVQVDFEKTTKVEGVATQGRGLQYDQWVTQYKILFSNDGVAWTTYQEDGQDKIFVGNSDMDSVVRNDFATPIQCRFIRLNPVTWNHHISLRLEYYGCLEVCESALGMSTGALDRTRVASSTDYDINHDAKRARLNTYPIVCQAWAARFTNLFQWLQVDVGFTTTITAVATQGRGDIKFPQRVTKYRLDYSLDGHTWTTYGANGVPTIIEDNVDARQVAYNRLNPTFKARFVRFHPTEIHGHPSMRVEIFGCPQKCNFPLGMSTGAISGHQLAISSYAHPGCEAYSGRLNLYTPVGSWCSRFLDQNQWIQINLIDLHRVTGISTQGRAFFDQWVTSYSVSFSVDGINWVDYKAKGSDAAKIFRANFDRDSVIKRGVNFVARFVRIHPRTWFGHISMRAELYGCPAL